MKYLATFFLLLSLAISSYCQPVNYIIKADKLFEEGYFEEAIKEYSKIKNEQLKNYVNYRIANSYAELQDYKSSKKVIKEILKINPNEKDYYFFMGNTYWLLGRNQSKQGFRKEALDSYINGSLYIEDAKLYSTIGYCLLKLEKYKEAEETLNYALRLNNKNAYAYSNRALAYINLDKMELAKQDIEISKKLDPNNPYVYKHEAIWYFHKGNNDTGCKLLDIASKKGYEFFGNEFDQKEVKLMQDQFCKEH